MLFEPPKKSAKNLAEPAEEGFFALIVCDECRYVSHEIKHLPF